jgi:hypothetical protein
MLSFHLPLQSTLNGLDTFRHVNVQNMLILSYSRCRYSSSNSPANLRRNSWISDLRIVC